MSFFSCRPPHINGRSYAPGPKTPPEPRRPTSCRPVGNPCLVTVAFSPLFHALPRASIRRIPSGLKHARESPFPTKRRIGVVLSRPRGDRHFLDQSHRLRALAPSSRQATPLAIRRARSLGNSLPGQLGCNVATWGPPAWPWGFQPPREGYRLSWAHRRGERCCRLLRIRRRRGGKLPRCASVPGRMASPRTKPQSKARTGTDTTLVVRRVAGFLPKPKKDASGDTYRGRHVCTDVQWTGEGPDIFNQEPLSESRIKSASQTFLGLDNQVNARHEPNLPTVFHVVQGRRPGMVAASTPEKPGLTWAGELA